MATQSFSFNNGVASGDPYRDSVILWTRISPPAGVQNQASVIWEVASTADFLPSSQVATGSFQTDASRDWTVKVEAKSLKSGQEYYYRFKVGDVVSPVGQTKTLAATTDSVHLAVFSCSNYTAVPEFYAYGRAATIDASRPYDAALFLGDYIYEYGAGGYAAAEDAVQVRGFAPNRELISLADYRERYAQYSTDPGLLALRASMPIIAIWDDHETANDSYKSGAENHTSTTEGAWNDRVAAALKAFYEWIPIREPSQRQGLDAGTASTPLTQGYRSFTFGDVLSLHMLETRLGARDKQLAYPDAAAVQARIGAILADPALTASYAKKYSLTPPTSATDAAGIQAFGKGLATPVTSELVQATVLAAYGDTNRNMVGPIELSWLQQQMGASQATWQVLGQQVLMMNVAVPAELLLNPGDATLLAKYAQPLQKLANGTKFSDLSPSEQALFSESTKIPYNLDAWDGYGADREKILQSALALGKKLVSLAGDTHNAWAGDLTTMSPANAGTLAGLEFATPGVSSPGFEKYFPGVDAQLRKNFASVDGLDAIFESYVKDVSYADLNHRGFLDMTFTRSNIQADFELIDSYDPISGVPIWRSEQLSANGAMKLSTASSKLADPLPIVWQTDWQELDLQTGVAISKAGKVTTLDPADYGVVPTSSVLLPKAVVQGSSAADIIDASSGNRIDAGGGNDVIRSQITGSRGNNKIFGGTGSDTFYLGAAGDKVYGGRTSNDPSGSIADGEVNTYIVDLDLLRYDGTDTGRVSIMDFQVGRDRLQLILPGGAMSDVLVDSSTYATRQAELLRQGVLINRYVANTTSISNGSVQIRNPIYVSPSGQVMTARMTCTSGSIEGDVSFDRLAAAPTFTNQKAGLVIGQTGINFSLKLDQSSNSNTAKTAVDLAPLLDGLSTTNKRLAYFVYSTPADGAAPVATPFTYDPTKKAGARFYDLDGNGAADTADLQFVDGGYGDKDGTKNGVVVDPSTPGVVSLTPKFTASPTALTIADPNDSTSPAALTVRATLTAKAASVNQIGYVALNANEADTLTYELVRDRGTILLANLESSDTPNVTGMNFQRDINLINGQKLVFFEVVDTTLESLLAKNTTLQGFGTSFRTLDLSKSTDTAATASKGGNTVVLSLLNDSAIAGLGELISSQMADTPILDFTGLAGRTLVGSVSLAREANYDSTIGFYRIQQADGAVRDPITNALITPGSAGYRTAALSSTNLFSGFGTLAVANGATRTDKIAAFNESGLLAPYATVAQTGDTFFSFRSANSDNLNHFRVLGSGVIGLEDVAGGFDQDFDDNIVSFNFKLK